MRRSATARPAVEPRRSESGDLACTRRTRAKLPRPPLLSATLNSRRLVEPIDDRPVGLAEPGRQFDERVEDRLQVEGRPADRLEHVGGRCLLPPGPRSTHGFLRRVRLRASPTTRPCVRRVLSPSWGERVRPPRLRPFAFTPPASSVVARWTALVGMQIYHTLAA